MPPPTPSPLIPTPLSFVQSLRGLYSCRYCVCVCVCVYLKYVRLWSQTWRLVLNINTSGRTKKKSIDSMGSRKWGETPRRQEDLLRWKANIKCFLSVSRSSEYFFWGGVTLIYVTWRARCSLMVTRTSARPRSWMRASLLGRKLWPSSSVRSASVALPWVRACVHARARVCACNAEGWGEGYGGELIRSWPEGST